MREFETTSRIHMAYKYMISKHGLQKRKTGELYIEHPKAVARLAMLYKFRSWKIEDIIIICLLHDVIEDTDATYEEVKHLFGKIVADTVLELTNISKDMKKAGSKKKYLSEKMVTMSDYGLFVKLLDRENNVSTLSQTEPEFRDRQISDTLYILDYVKKNRLFKTMTHHEVICNIEIILQELQEWLIMKEIREDHKKLYSYEKEWYNGDI